jgi:hypothetical protein
VSWFADRYLVDKAIHKAEAAPRPPSPEELVDRAWAIPGAIVLSPHRDLVEMGLYDVKSGWAEVHLLSPAIAVHSRKGWCVWPLGDFGVHVDGDDDAVKSAGDTIQINPKIDSHIIGIASDYVTGAKAGALALVKRSELGF